MKSASWVSLAVLSLGLAPATDAFAQILPPARATVWNPGIPGGVPARTTVCATLNAASYGNGANSASTAIQNAIDNCPVGQVIQLSAGSFRITPKLLLDKGIVIRGAGPRLTILKMPNGKDEAVLSMGFQYPTIEHIVNLTSNAVKGATSVTVSSAAGIAVGELVLIDELTDPSITQWSADSPPGDASRGWFSRTERPLAQMMEVAGVAGNTLTFTTPFHIGFDLAHSAQLSRFTQYPGGPMAAAVRNAGLEDLKVYGGEGGDGGGNIYMELCAYCWVKNVESEYSMGGSIALYHTFRSVIRDSYLHGSKDPNPGGNGYGFSINTASADNLIENNISWNFNKVILMRASGGGNVIGYNYFEDGYGETYKTIVEIGLNASHMTTPHFELFEGNEAFNIDGDARWGNSVYITYFRNHATGLRRSLGGLGLSDVGNRHMIGAQAGHYWYSFIGNVLGSAGMSPKPGGNSFRYDGVYPWDDDPVPIWKLGYDDPVGTPNVTTDAQVAATALREGNFDYATNTVKWSGAAQTIPNSLYLTSKPAFFGSNPWPWVDPVGTTKLYTLPARTRFDQGSGSIPQIKFYTVTPCRVADTRNAAGPAGGPALSAGQTRDFQVAGLCGIPLDARAVAANVTAVFAPLIGHLTLSPPGLSLSPSSNINMSPARTALANNLTVGLGTSGLVNGGAVSVFCGLPAGGVHFILDVVGYYK